MTTARLKDIHNLKLSKRDPELELHSKSSLDHNNYDDNDFELELHLESSLDHNNDDDNDFDNGAKVTASATASTGNK